MKKIVLYNGKYFTMKRYIVFEIKNNCATISGQDLGSEEYEFFYDLNEEETKKLLNLVPLSKIKSTFKGPEAFENFKIFCDNNGIKYKFSAF